MTAEELSSALLDRDTELPPVRESFGDTNDELTRPDTVTETGTTKRSRLPLTNEELFAGATRPASIPGLDSWGIPDEVDPSECSSQLKAKVAQFLALKVDQNQHINTSLLASSTFHNPHIYSKLVEFVDLDERDSFFPRHGWLTRCGIEDEIQQYGPKRMSEEQKRMQEDAKARQEIGKRSEIAFQPGRNGRDKGVDRHTTGGGSGKVYERPKARDEDRAFRSERERDRERDRFRRDRPRDVGSSGKYSNTLGFGRRDREGGWDERDMTKEKPRYRYY